jgi:hypothetical protein
MQVTKFLKIPNLLILPQVDPRMDPLISKGASIFVFLIILLISIFLFTGIYPDSKYFSSNSFII